MKIVSLLTFLFLSQFTFAQGAPRTMEFWDGSFAYNKLVLKEAQFNGNFVTLELTGATLGLGPQIEGTPKRWGVDDKVVVSLKKSDCQIDFSKKTLLCDAARASGLITWTINSRVSKNLKTIFENIKFEASSAQFGAVVKVSFDLKSDEYFSPLNETIAVDFAALNSNF